LQLHDRGHQSASAWRANFRSIAAVNAYRLGCFRRGLRHSLAAAAARPGRLIHWGRLALALAPPLARRFWIDSGTDSGAHARLEPIAEKPPCQDL
jgi:hypothetical protein